ncbi:Tau95 domain-containing protein [Aphelenchoides besseyi]|nr:Tau95 domain-containing protein [Aphelenchoides besseyi]
MDKVRRKVGLPPSREPEVAKKSKRRGSSESSNQSKDSSLGIPSDISSDLLDSDDEIGVVEFAISSDEENVVGEANEESAFVDVLNFEGHAETEGDAHEIYAQYRGYPQIKQFRLSSEGDLDLSYVSKELSEQSKDNTYYMVLNNHESLIGYFPWQTTFSIYKLIAEYEVFRVNCSASQSQGWLSRIRQLIEILEQKERAVILLPPLIELSIELNDREGLFETFRDLCEQSPVIFEHVTRILKAHGQEREAYRLYEQLYNEHKSLAVFDTTIDFLYRFAAEPTAHGPLEDVVTSNLSAAFTTLDHGRNRNSLKAWTALHMSLRFVESQPGIIQRFWSPRKSWWPRFHFTFDERTECKKLKKKCFKRMSTTNFVLVEHPGVIKNSERAITTLGGRDSINEVQNAYKFKSLCDFQFLPIRKHPTVKKSNETVYEDLVPRLVPTTFQSAFSWFKHPEPNNEAVPRFLPPFVFSRYTSGVMSKVLTQDTERVTESSGPGTCGQNLRMERKAWTVTVQADEQFPSEPSEAAVKDVDLRVLLAKYSFYILSGPWGRLWCRFGYDPRKDPKAKQYQTIMVSFRKHQNIPERQRLKLAPGERVSTLHNNTPAFQYTPGHLPAVRQMWYSVCDIKLPAAQKILRSDYFATLPQCNPTSGWLTAAIKEDVVNTSKSMEGNSDVEGAISDDETTTMRMDDENLDENEFY